jgi:hypothetical protein
MTQDESGAASVPPDCPRCASPMISGITSPQPRLQLIGWRCPSCRKTPQVGCESLCLVFRSGEQYVFAVDDSTKIFTVRLSSAAIGLFKSHGIGADDLARIAARWALGRGRKTVTLELSSQEFTDLYLSLCPYLDEGLPQAA